MSLGIPTDLFMYNICKHLSFKDVVSLAQTSRMVYKHYAKPAINQFYCKLNIENLINFRSSINQMITLPCIDNLNIHKCCSHHISYKLIKINNYHVAVQFSFINDLNNVIIIVVLDTFNTHVHPFDGTIIILNKKLCLALHRLSYFNECYPFSTHAPMASCILLQIAKQCLQKCSLGYNIICLMN